MEKLFNLSVALLLFFGLNVLNAFGYSIAKDYGPAIFKIHPCVYICSLIVLYEILVLKKNYRSYKEVTYFSIFLVILMAYLIFSGLTSDIAFIPNTLILPILISMITNRLTSESWTFISKSVLVFFVVNCCLAIFERALSTHFFPLMNPSIDIFGFRSTSLQSHPLNNALLTLVFLLFAMFCDKYSEKTKLMLYFLGMIAIICFGSRSSLIGGLVILVIYLVRYLISSEKKGKLLIVLFTFILTALGMFVVFSTSFGERLLSVGLFDESANVRVELFDIFGFVTFDDLIWGLSKQTTTILKDKADVIEIENFWIIWIFRFGLVMFIPLVVLFIRYLLFSLRAYPLSSKFIITVLFLLIASTNNSLGSTTVVISFFILCAISFNNFYIRNSKLTHEKSRSIYSES